MLGDLCGVDAKNVTGFVLGEHGSTSLYSMEHKVNIVGVPFGEFEKQFELKEKLDKEKLLHDTKVIGLDIVELKGLHQFWCGIKCLSSDQKYRS